MERESEMLRFEQRPDKVFLAILHAALEDTRQEIQDFIEDEDDDDEAWRNWQPMVARFFSPQAVVEQLDRLLTASEDHQLYQITDYHWLLIYNCLGRICEIHNDFAAQDPSGTCLVGPYEIGSIDFDAIVDDFFWDTDFLMDDTLLDVSSERRHQLGVSPETFGIAAGLLPHPSELEIRPFYGGPVWSSEEDPSPAGGPIPRYPLGEED